MNPVIEAEALRQTEESLREFVTVAKNIGISQESVALMLRTIADELSPPDSPTVTIN